MGRSFVLSVLMHGVLAAILLFGVRWQSHAPETVTVDLVDSPPPPAPVVEAPKPLPKVEPPPPPPVEKPVPKIEKPQIAIPDKPKPKPKPEVKPKAEVKPKPEVKPKVDPTFDKRMKEQMALEDQARQERELRQLLARKEAEAARAAASARQKALNEYIARIQYKVKSNWILPQDIQGNPEAIFLVVQLPTGEVLSTRLVKSSGNPAYDTAVERAILKSSPLPLPADRGDFSRELKLTFRPQDK